MAFRYYYTQLTIDNLVSGIRNELINTGGWTDPDPGYSVVRCVSGEFDIKIALETTNKRYLQFEVGQWNTGTHSMDDKNSCGHIFYNSASGASGGAKVKLYMSYDDKYCIIATDCRDAGANYMRCLTYIGLLDKLYAGDHDLLTAASSMYRNTPIPINTSAIVGVVVIQKDIGGSKTLPDYYIYCLNPCPASAVVDRTPRGLILAQPADIRYLVPMYLGSGSSTYPAGGEAAGIRGKFASLVHAFGDDQESHGVTIQTSDSKVYMYWITDANSYCHLPHKVLFRIQ